MEGSRAAGPGALLRSGRAPSIANNRRSEVDLPWSCAQAQEFSSQCLIVGGGCRRRPTQAAKQVRLEQVLHRGGGAVRQVCHRRLGGFKPSPCRWVALRPRPRLRRPVGWWVHVRQFRLGHGLGGLDEAPPSALVSAGSGGAEFRHAVQRVIGAGHGDRGSHERRVGKDSTGVHISHPRNVIAGVPEVAHNS